MHSQYWLGRSLCYEGASSKEAEKCFREVLAKEEMALGPDHGDTLTTKYWLAVSLYYQNKYNEAEKCFREVTSEFERTRGQDYHLVIKANEFYEAMLLKQETTTTSDLNPQGEAIHNVGEHSDSVIAPILETQIEYSKPEGSLPIRERHSQETPSRGTSSRLDDHSKQQLTNHLSHYFTDGRESPYQDQDISNIASLLKYSNPQWSKLPRTYIVLRTMDCLQVFDDLIATGFTDYLFPATEKTLSPVLHADQRSQFLRVQHLVLTKSLDLEKGQHCFFDKDETAPLDRQRILGQGGFGQVDEVVSLVSYKRYARKRVLRQMKLEHLRLFVGELETIKRLKHKHMVEFVGSYSDTKYLALLMRPVAEMDLSTYLTSRDISHRLGELRTFFGCLATALNFLHRNKIRHKDIKPQNILVNRGSVLLTDFGLSLDFTDAQGSTTVSMVNGMTPRYCAPEVAEYEPRNTSSDIWSLGVVFFEMFVVLKGQTVEYMDQFLAQHGSRRPYIRSNRKAMTELSNALQSSGRRNDNQVTVWTENMLQQEGLHRLTAEQLVNKIHDAGSKEGFEGGGFCGICCVPHHDDEHIDFSD